MSSQKSRGGQEPGDRGGLRLAAVQPKRDRGRRRVSAILDAAAAVIAERGFEATTMTEIAARSSTAIGSLYRFFPTKDVVADALLDRYVHEITTELDKVRDRVLALGPAGVADALVDLLVDLHADRAAAVALVDARADGSALRQALRSALGDGLAAICRRLAPRLEPERARMIAPVVLHAMKIGPTLLAISSERDAEARLTELRRMVRLYLADLDGSAGPSDHSPPSSE